MAVGVRTLQINHKLYCQRIHWISGAGGAFADTPIEHNIRGRILCVDTVPGSVALGGVVPAINYDIEFLTNDTGAVFDIMGAALIDRHDVNTERVLPILGIVPYEPVVRQGIILSMANITNAGATGDIYIYFEREGG